MRVVVTGSRHLKDPTPVHAYLDGFHEGAPISILAHGGARGVDTAAGNWAVLHGAELHLYFADWEHLGTAAGPIRNREMLDAEQPDRVIAFVDGPPRKGSGTWDCIEAALERNLPILIVPLLPEHLEPK